MVQSLFVMQPLFIGSTELILIGGIALLLFGGKKLPEMMRGLGQGVREFKKGVNEEAKDEAKDEAKEKEVEEDVKENEQLQDTSGKEDVGHDESDLKHNG